MTEKEFLKSYELYKKKYNKLENELNGNVKKMLSYSEYKNSYNLFKLELGGKNVLRQIIYQTPMVSKKQARILVKAYKNYREYSNEEYDYIDGKYVGDLTVYDFQIKDSRTKIFLDKMYYEREEGGGGVSDYVDSP